MTHRFDPSILEEFERIREGLRDGDEAFLLSDGSAQAPPQVAPRTHTFDCGQVLRRAARVIEEGILRNVHLAWIEFFEAHPGFEAYWFIEYDVVYSGHWAEVFDAFRDSPFDLLCSHLRPHAHEPGWYWWEAIHSPRQPLPADRLLRGFLPIARLSRPGMERLRDAVDEGWCGFLEGLVPTLFQACGLRLGDLGGDGPFVPPGFRNRFYTSVSNATGSLLDLGTMRFRPPIRFPRIRQGRLYHPVKPERDTFDPGPGQPLLACAALDRALDRILGLQQPHRVPPFLASANVDHLLQVFTGLRSVELLEALDQMETAGVDRQEIATLRHHLLALPSTLGSRPRITRIPAGGIDEG
jgi:hypothetical protein